MKGLLRKDFYLIRATLPLACLAMLVAGGCLSVLVSANVFLAIAPVVLGLVALTTVNIDRHDGWNRLAATLPCGPARAIGGKYLLYLLLSLGGVLLGLLLAVAGSALLRGWGSETFGIFFAIGLALPLLSGAVGLPAAFLLGEDKNMLVMMFSYPLASALFVALVLAIDAVLPAALVLIACSAAAYAASWLLAARLLPRRDLR